MLDIGPVVEQVKRNCDISDATYFVEKAKGKGREELTDSLFTKQIMDLYVSEMGIEPWEDFSFKTDPNVNPWIVKKIKTWKELKDEKLSRISINGKEYEYLDMDGINQKLNPEAYFYLRGIEYPEDNLSFLLADLAEVRRENGYQIYILGNELTRSLGADLSKGAYSLLKYLIIRKDVLKRFLWEKVLRLKSDEDFPEKRVLEQAFQYFELPKSELSGDPEEIDRKLEKILLNEIETKTYHEIGHKIIEETKRVMTREVFVRLMNSLHKTDLRWYIIAVNDVLADTCKHRNLKGRLSYIIDQKDKGSLAIYVYDTMVNSKSKFSGKYYAQVFPELISAYEKFRETGDWGVIEDARKAGYRRARRRVMQFRKKLK